MATSIVAITPGVLAAASAERQAERSEERSKKAPRRQGQAERHMFKVK